MGHPKMTRKEVCGAIIGMTMGDGWMIQNPYRDGGYHGNYKLGISHCPAQIPYLEWKRDIVNHLFEYPIPINFKAIVSKDRQKIYPSYRFVTRVHSRISFIAKHIYVDREKRITDWVLENITNIGLAIWWMDDGCLWLDNRPDHGGGALIFSLYGFPKEDVEKFSAWLFEKYGVAFNLNFHKKSGGWVLRRGISEGWKFLEAITPYAHECMKRKFEWAPSITRKGGTYNLSNSSLAVPTTSSEAMI
jgi:hypothetical protein